MLRYHQGKPLQAPGRSHGTALSHLNLFLKEVAKWNNLWTQELLVLQPPSPFCFCIASSHFGADCLGPIVTPTSAPSSPLSDQGLH